MYPNQQSHNIRQQQQPNARDYYMPTEQRMPGFQEFISRYEINKYYSKKLLALDGFEIVFICDDSGSMNTPLNDVFGPFNNPPTRWDELKQTVSIVVDLASVLDPNGVDIYFLNRKPIFNVRNSSELADAFSTPPRGVTPIARVLREILQNKAREIQERNLLVLIATDGAPTDDNGYQDPSTLKNILKHERHPINRIPVTIIACTDDEQDIDYLNGWDREIPHLDVVDDFRSEKKEVLKCQGPNFPFSFGDYIVKILLGGVFQEIDDLDEKKLSLNSDYERF